MKLTIKRTVRPWDKPASIDNAFTRTDLIAVIAVVVLLGAWFAYGHLGERGRTARCAGNLAALGRAMQSYAIDHDDGIPAAGVDIGSTRISWDTTLFPYLKPKLAKSSGAYEKRQLLAGVSPFFFCPSDTASHKTTPRSYAMSGNDMLPEHWPPGPDSPTGVGLWWNKQTVLALLDNDALQKPELLPAVKLSNVPAPVNTLLLTELIDPNNNLGSTRQVTVFNTSQQERFFKDGGGGFHHGRFNYLMVDGHVESFSPLQPLMLDGSSGMWSLKKGN
jgi:prepilin-type processing-associated H-X9-DG protein